MTQCFFQNFKGSSFIIALPADSKAKNVLPAVIHSSSLRSLVVDDDSFNRDLHKLLLEREGTEVVVASNGREAVEIFMATPEGYFSFILMDINMPVMDGITAMQEIRKFEANSLRTRLVDVVFLTGDYEVPEILKPLINKDAFDDYCANKKNTGRRGKMLLFPKPIETAKIRQIIHAYIDKVDVS